MSTVQDEVFHLFHRHRKLVRRGLAKPLTCQCGGEYYASLGQDDELVLRCYSCDKFTVPGVKTIKNIEAIVKEHFVDE